MTQDSDPSGPAPTNGSTPDGVDLQSAPQRLLAGRYRLDGLLGRGSMGAVWRAHDTVLRRAVAVKEVLLPDSQSRENNEVARERALREARAIAALSHPNVVTLFDVVEDDGRPWVVMELVPAPSLAQILTDHGALSPQETARISLAVLDALDAAHQVGITHRDIKPGNILVSADGRVKLADFGISRKLDESQLTQAGLMVGSPSYIAPEVARGKEAGRPSDIWGLGATMHCAVEGTPPFDLGDPVATLTAVVGQPARPAPHSGPLGPVIARCLDKDPRTRIQADELRRLLTQIALGTQTTTLPMARQSPPIARPVSAPPQPAGTYHQGPPTPPPPIRRPVAQESMTALHAMPTPPRRTSVWIAAVAAAVLVIGGLVAVLVLNHSPSSTAANSSSTSTQTTTAPSAAPPTGMSGGQKKQTRLDVDVKGMGTGSILIGSQYFPFQIQLPTGWDPATQSDPHRAEFVQGSSASAAQQQNITVVAGAYTGPSVADQIQATESDDGSPGSFDDYRQLSFKTTHGALVWEYTYTLDGQPRHGFLYAVNNNGVLWEAVVQGPESQAKNLSKMLDKVTKSFPVQS